MVLQLIAVRLNDFALALLDRLVEELNDFAAVDTHHVIVVVVAGDFEHGMAAIKIVPLHDAGGLELRQHTVDRGQPYILTGID